MIRSFLTITFRILWRNKVTSFVNIFSVGVGITAFIFIMLYVHHEMSYDKFNTNYDRIYRLEADDWAKLPPVLGMLAKDKLPEVENVAFLAMDFKNFLSYSPAGHPEKIKQIEVNRIMADSTTFSVFSFSFTHGDPHTALKDPMTAVLTESTAKMLFGDVNPMGQDVEFENSLYRITGIIKDIKLFHIEIDFLMSLSSFAKLRPEYNINMTAQSSWAWSATYLMMKSKIREDVVEEKINQVMAEINDGKLIDTEFKQFHIRPLRDLYFHRGVQRLSYGLHGDLKAVMTLIAIGVFLLVLAVINYVNLTTARSSVRFKEIAVKRVTGSPAHLLRWQLIGESIIISLISLIAALTVVQLFLPEFNSLSNLNIETIQLNTPLVWLVLTGGGILVGVLAGIYPALTLVTTQPIRLLKGVSNRGSERAGLRSGLMAFQFAISIIMLVAIMTNFRQMNYLRTAELGFSTKGIITALTPDSSPEKYSLRETFKSNLMQYSGIEKITFSAGIPGGSVADLPTVEINGTRTSIKAIWGDLDYLEAMGIELDEGRKFSLGDAAVPNGYWAPRSRLAGVLINETAVRELGLVNPVGQVFYTVDSNRFQFEIIGVVKDFHFQSLHEKVEPIVIGPTTRPLNTLSIKFSTSNIPSTLIAIENEWKKVWGSAPFHYQFLDETFNQQYHRDEQLAKVIGFFTSLAVIIACLGLFALSSFMVSRRVKEIGVRKVLGASVGTIYSMLSWDFLKWILVAIVIATPFAWFLMKMWLSTFAYHIDLGVDVFVIAALIAIGIALLTVTGQTLKVAASNPVDSLKYE